MLEAYVEVMGNIAFGVVCENEAVCASNFGIDEADVLQSFQRMFSLGAMQVATKPSSFAEKAVNEVRNVYEGKGVSQSVPLNLTRFAPYTQRVLRAVSRVPVGYVVSYGGVAQAVGGGARAVGNAMATNCFAPLVPCHRVVTSSLGLGGYGGAGNCGGLRVKFEFLKREKRGYSQPKDVSTEGGLMRVFPVEFVLTKLEKSAIWKHI
jgi:methylated-DNA-[protein]-cysteine S-methyltransferase